LLFIHPVVLGAGRPLFDDLEQPVECDLIESKALEGGVVMHRYSIRHPTLAELAGKGSRGISECPIATNRTKPVGIAEGSDGQMRFAGFHKAITGSVETS